MIARIKAKIQQCRAEKQAEPEAIIFEPVERSALAQDAAYLDIFHGMANDALKEARGVLDQLNAGKPVECGALNASLEHLRYAAGQIGIAGWEDALADFLAAPVASVARLHALIASMQALMSGNASKDTDAESANPIDDTDTAPPDGSSFAASELMNFMDEDAPSPDAADRSLLAADPTYRGIFFDMVHDILLEMQGAVTEFETDPQHARCTLASQVDRLLHASKQIGMPNWPELLAEYSARPDLLLDRGPRLYNKA